MSLLKISKTTYVTNFTSCFVGLKKKSAEAGRQIVCCGDAGSEVQKAAFKKDELELRRQELEFAKQKYNDELEEKKARAKLELQEKRAYLELLKNRLYIMPHFSLY